MMRLTPEILCHIFDYSNYRTIFRALRISREWREAALLFIAKNPTIAYLKVESKTRYFQKIVTYRDSDPEAKTVYFCRRETDLYYLQTDPEKKRIFREKEGEFTLVLEALNIFCLGEAIIVENPRHVFSLCDKDFNLSPYKNRICTEPFSWKKEEPFFPVMISGPALLSAIINGRDYQLFAPSEVDDLCGKIVSILFVNSEYLVCTAPPKLYLVDLTSGKRYTYLSSGLDRWETSWPTPYLIRHPAYLYLGLGRTKLLEINLYNFQSLEYPGTSYIDESGLVYLYGVGHEILTLYNGQPARGYIIDYVKGARFLEREKLMIGSDSCCIVKYRREVYT